MKFVKNVTDHNSYRAYLDCEGVFRLHFKHYPNTERIDCGDTIALLQQAKVKALDGAETTQSCFTHLLAVLDGQVHTLAQDVDPNNEYRQYIFVYTISKGAYPIASTQKWANIHKGGISQGRLVGVENIEPVVEGKYSAKELKEEVWNLFFPVTPTNFTQEIIARGKY